MTPRKTPHWPFSAIPLVAGLTFAGATPYPDDFPIVPGDVEVALFAEQPLVRNPCAITFNAKGELCVGMGPQYRTPKPETPPDSVWVLHDHDRDGKADGRTEFATGFNNIQGLAWKGEWLWVANAPDLTRVRDTDGDGVADEYIREFTDLGNLEHGLHGLQFGPDGMLYMSKGNSKGLTVVPDRIAPAPFRELWGVELPPDTPEPAPVTFAAEDYQKNYHDPADDWGITGGVLRCDDDGSNLEIVCRGFRNPWDIAFDDGFDWLGTDNDQTHGDKFFTPFFGAHFGWGHPWSYDWKGDDHLPSAPSSGPLFEGSGTGVVFCGLERYPQKYRGVFLVGDWLRREIYLYRPKWDGALRVADGNPFQSIASAGGGRAMNESKGRRFDPVDIEIGPDGAIWVSSWGRQYGAHYEGGKLANEGRIYRLWPKEAPPQKWGDGRDPLVDLGSHLPVWRTDAQAALIERGDPAPLRAILKRDDLPKSLETWAVWTLGRMTKEKLPLTGSLNRRIQLLRLQQRYPFTVELDDALIDDPEPRIRLEAATHANYWGLSDWLPLIVDRLAIEEDRLVYYALWKALANSLHPRKLVSYLRDERPGVRRGALLALLEEDALDDESIRTLVDDPDPATAGLARKRLGGRDDRPLKGRPLVATRTGFRDVPEQAPSVMVNPFGEILPSSGNPYRVAALAPGVMAYTDRPYRITEVPPELVGEAFLKTANNDADPPAGISVEVELRYPCTLYLADDLRGERPPSWVMQGGWQPTEMTLSSSDAVMRLFRREARPGKVVLGTNRDGVKGPKANYLLIAVPKLLDPPADLTIAGAALAALPEADAARGRDLYFSKHGAACAACHRLDGVGNNHAPDLSDIGSRADAAFLVESILNPSAAITEGLAAQMVTTKSGAVYTGILLEETGREITIAMTGGLKVKVARDEIASRKGMKISAMPNAFGSMLQPQQVADITAFLLEGQGPPAPNTGDFSFERSDGQLVLKLGDVAIATYLLDHPVLTRRAFVNVKTPSGIPVTRGFPAPEGDDHASMHPGIWLGFGWVDGNDYWRLQSRVAFDGYLEKPVADGQHARFAARNRFLDKDGTGTVCIEETRYTFARVPEGISLGIDATYYNDQRDFAFGDQEESGLAVRMAKPLTVQFGNGSITNNLGDRDGKGTWGKEFEWVEYSGRAGGRKVGIKITPHPENPRPSWAHSRDYGALVANPFPRQPKERREPYVKTVVKKGERFRLRYQLLIRDESHPHP